MTRYVVLVSSSLLTTDQKEFRANGTANELMKYLFDTAVGRRDTRDSVPVVQSVQNDCHKVASLRHVLSTPENLT